MKDLDLAKSLLRDGNTCVLVKGEDKIISKQSGIRPMLDILISERDVKGYALADKIVGKAVAYLAILAKVSVVYAEVLSVQGKNTLEKYGIKYEYSTLTEIIINRKGDGQCPMEETVSAVDDPSVAFNKLKDKVYPIF